MGDLHQHVVTKPTGNHGIVHDGLVGLVLEVRIPSRLEMGCRPRLELLQLFFSRSDLDASVDTIGRQRSGSLEIPFLKDTYFLDQL
jgi:hypothetical protein